MLDESQNKNKVNTNGIGLGLVISQLIIKKFNGIIDFTSKYGEGSCFYFTFEVEDFDKMENCNKQDSSENLDFQIIDVLAEEKNENKEIPSDLF